MRRVHPSTQLLIDIIVEECMTCCSCSLRMSQSALNMPKSLDCSHTFCTSCMEKSKTGMGIFSTIVCPTCNVETTVGITGVSGLKNNHTILSLINILEVFSANPCDSCHVKPAEFRCLSCPDKPSLCESCQSDPEGPHVLHDMRELDLHTSDASLKRTGSTPSMPRASPLGLRSSGMEEVMTSVIECPRSIVGRVISSQGNSFDNIRAQTFCNIEFRRLSDRHMPALIAIRGPRNRVQQARSMIDQIMGDVLQSDSVLDESSSSNGSNSDRPPNRPNLADDDVCIEISHYHAIVLFELRYDEVLQIARDTNTSITLFHHAISYCHNIIVRPQGSAAQGVAQLGRARELLSRMLESPPITDSERDMTSRIGISADMYDSSLEVAETIMLPKVQYHKLVSSGYAILNKIALRVGCRIDITEESNTGMGIVTFRGNRLEVDEAQDLLRSSFDRRPHTFTTSSVPPGFHMSEGIAGVQEERRALSPHAEAHSPFSSHLLSTNKSQVLLSNTPDEQRKRHHSFSGHSATASTLNSETSTPISGVHIRSTKTTPMREGPVSTFIDCEYDTVGKLIGVKGSRIDELRALTGCKIFVLKGRNSSACRVEVRGRHDKVSTAVPLLKMVLGSGELAMSKIRAMHSSLMHQAMSSGDQEDVGQMLLDSSSSFSDGRTALSLDRLTQALQLHVESVGGKASTSLDVDGGHFPRNVAHPVEELNRSGSVEQSPLSETRPPRSRVISRQSSSTKDEGCTDPTLALPPPDMADRISVPSLSRASPGILRSLTGSYMSSASDSDEEQSNDGEGSTSRSVGSLTKYTVSPPSSPPTSSLYPEYFFKPHSLLRSEELYQCDDESSLLNKRVLDDIAMKARCQITPEQERSTHQPLLLRLKGHADQRELAKLLISSVLKPFLRSSALVHNEGLDGMIRTMTCPPHFIPVLIGPGGSTIENIQAQTATRILINEHKDEDCPPAISIIGCVAGVEIAVSMLDRLVLNHRFKYRQQPLTAESRARSLPAQPASAIRASDCHQERSERDDDEDTFDGESGGRNLMTRTPSPPRQSQGEAGGYVQLRSSSTNKKDTPPSSGGGWQPTQSPVLRSLRQQTSVTSMPSFSSLSASSTGGDSSCTSPLPFLKSTPQSPQSSRSGSHQTQSSLPSTTIEYLPPPAASEDVPEGSVHIAMQCPMDKVAQVIGKRGSILREVKRLSECEIVVDQTNSPAAQIQQGNKLGSKSPPPSRVSSTANTSVPPGGLNTAAASNTGGGGTLDNTDREFQVIRIIGTPVAVDKAVKLISAVIELGPIVALGMQTEIMECPLDKVPLVIGVRGLTAKEMMRRTGCKIHVNEDVQGEAGTMCTIELTGTEEQLEQAKKLISHVLEFGTKALGKRFQRVKKEEAGESPS